MNVISTNNSPYENFTVIQRKSVTHNISPTRPFIAKVPMRMIFIDSLRHCFEYDCKFKEFNYKYTVFL